MRPGRPFLVRSVTVTIDGVTHHGTYYVQGQVVHVRSPLGEKITRSEGRHPKQSQGCCSRSWCVREANRQATLFFEYSNFSGLSDPARSRSPRSPTMSACQQQTDVGWDVWVGRSADERTINTHAITMRLDI